MVCGPFPKATVSKPKFQASKPAAVCHASGFVAPFLSTTCHCTAAGLTTVKVDEATSEEVPSRSARAYRVCSPSSRVPTGALHVELSGRSEERRVGKEGSCG